MQPESRYDPGRGMDTQFWKWLVFGVALALMPIGFHFMYIVTVPRLELSWSILLGRGELLLLAVGLSAGAMGDLVLMRPGWGAFKVVTTGICAANIAFSSGYFMLVSGRYGLGEQTESGAVVIISIVLYAVAVISSGLCVLLEER